jgi:EAL domain-containing protein (putative c-di-GMP-specific phosphodiesterase class I)
VGDRALRAIAKEDLSARRVDGDRGMLDPLAREIPAAIERGELALQYQPVVEIRTGRCFRVEGLVRWMHPRQGSIGARDVVRLADLSNALVPLAAWSLHEAIRQRERWESDDLHLGVSLNLVGRELRAEGAATLLGVIRKLGARPAAFTFEVAAGDVRRDASLGDGIRVLASAGARVALDDVSPADAPGRTAAIDLEELKISRSLVLRAVADPDARTGLRRLVAQAKDLGLVTVAVGVEDGATFELLSSLGCDLAQGYWMSRPLVARDVARWRQLATKALLTSATAAAAFTGLAKIAAAATAPAAQPYAGPGLSARTDDPGARSTCCTLRSGGDVRATGLAMRTVDVGGVQAHLESSLSSADAARVADAIARDVAATERTFGQSFDRAPTVYVMASRGSFALALQSAFGQRATEAAALAAANGGVAFPDRATIVVNWQNAQSQPDLAIVRHELTHLMAHQLAGPSVDLPAWFDEGLATLAEHAVAGDAVADARSDSATMTLLRQGGVTLQDLSAASDWTLRNAALGGRGYDVAAAGVEVLQTSLGAGGVSALLQRAHDVGFARAFGEATGGSVADFSRSFPARFASVHAAPVLLHAPASDGIRWVAAGLPADAKVHVAIHGGDYHLEFDAATDRDGTYTAVFGATAPAGDYTFDVTGLTGHAAMTVRVGGPAMPPPSASR